MVDLPLPPCADVEVTSDDDVAVVPAVAVCAEAAEGSAVSDAPPAVVEVAFEGGAAPLRRFASTLACSSRIFSSLRATSWLADVSCCVGR